MSEQGTGEQKGVGAIERALATMPLSPGVYRMLDAKGEATFKRSEGNGAGAPQLSANRTESSVPARTPARCRRARAGDIVRFALSTLEVIPLRWGGQRPRPSCSYHRRLTL